MEPLLLEPVLFGYFHMRLVFYRYRGLFWLLLVSFSQIGLAASPQREKETGKVSFSPSPLPRNVAARFRLEKHEFSFERVDLGEVFEKLSMSRVTFPSPVMSPHAQNNTVHCEYYRPHRKDPVPGVIVLHILGGDFQLSRMFCHALAHRGVAAMLVKMPYYGPRRVMGVSRRMIDKDPQLTVEGMTQAVLDIRRATAWLGSRQEIDPERLGLFGISLGGITGALVAGVEPRLKHVCLLLAGGDIGRIAWESPEVREIREHWLKQGKKREDFLRAMASIDPVQYGGNVRGRRILMLNAKEDEVIPKPCTLALWEALGQPEIVWYSGGHYSVIRHLLDAIRRVTDFFVAAS
jgi:cephalosporin-C deacetylase-like acetyl esterase